MRFLFTAFGCLLIFMSCVQARAAPAKMHALSAEAFALRQVYQGNSNINFDDNCPGNPTPGLAEATKNLPAKNLPIAWQAPCRTLNGIDLIKILSKAVSLGNLNIEGVNLVRSPGDNKNRIYLYSTKEPISFKIFYSHIADWLDLENATFKELDIEHTDFAGRLSTANMILDDDFKLDSDRFADLADLKEMSITNYILLSSLDGDNELQVNGISTNYLFLQNNLQFNKIVLSGSEIKKSLNLNQVVGTSLIECQRCTAEELDINVDPNTPSSFAGDLDFSGSNFNIGLQIQNATFSGIVNFENIDAGNISILHSVFRQNLWIDYAQVAGIVHFSNVTLQSLSLSEAKIGKALDLANVDASPWPASGGGLLDVSNTSTGTFTDCEAAWPAHLDLDGFHYDGIGISASPSDVQSGPKLHCQEISGSGDRGWLQFLSRSQDPTGTFNPQPYTYLAKYFAEDGNNQYANDILYTSRYRSLKDAWRSGNRMRVVGLGFLWIFAGFGIGGRAVWHLAATIVVSVAFAWVVLWRSKEARRKGSLWCLGACVARLLPIVKLLKEFDDYFDEPDADPKNPKLAGWQKLIFSIYALWGWIIGFLLVAVLSGVTQAP